MSCVFNHSPPVLTWYISIKYKYSFINEFINIKGLKWCNIDITINTIYLFIKLYNEINHTLIPSLMIFICRALFV